MYRLYQNNNRSKWFLFCEENAIVNYNNLLMLLEDKDPNKVSTILWLFNILLSK